MNKQRRPENNKSPIAIAKTNQLTRCSKTASKQEEANKNSGPKVKEPRLKSVWISPYPAHISPLSLPILLSSHSSLESTSSYTSIQQRQQQQQQLRIIITLLVVILESILCPKVGRQPEDTNQQEAGIARIYCATLASHRLDCSSELLFHLAKLTSWPYKQASGTAVGLCFSSIAGHHSSSGQAENATRCSAENRVSKSVIQP